MKTLFKKTLLVLMVAFIAVFTLGVSSKVKAAEEVYKTLYFDANTMQTSISAYDKTWNNVCNSDTWSIVNANNNQKKWTYIKFGRKNVASVGSINTSFAIDKAVTKVVMTVDSLTVSKINSLKLYVCTDSSFSNVSETVTATAASGAVTFTVNNPIENAYYKLEFDCASGSSNGLITVSKVEYYVATSAPMVTVTGDSFTEQDDVVQLTANLSNISGTVAWSSSDENIASVDQNGNVTAKAFGQTTITANCSGTIGSLLFTVYPTDGTELTIAEALQVCEYTDTTECAFTYSVVGTIESIDTAYDSSYGNITVTITDGTDSIKAFRMAGGEELIVGDKIKVTGTLVNYYGNTPEFIQGCTYVAVQDGDIVADAKEALTGVNAYMTMAYKYTVEKVSAPSLYKIVANELGYENGVAVESLNNGVVTLTFDKGENSNAPKYYTTGEAIRCYGGNSITFSSSVNITKIELTFASGEGTNAITVDSGTYADGIWTGSSTNVVLTIGGTTGHRRIATITVSYEGGSDLITDAYSDVEFRIRCGVDSTLADIEGIQKYGIRVVANGTTKDYAWNETDGIYGSDDSKLFVTISLGDVLNKKERLTTEFTVCAYVVIDGVTYISENTKTYSIASMVTEYYEVEGISEVADLYNRITSDLI